MSVQGLNILTIVVLTPLFVVASVGGFFLIMARPNWRGALASYLSFSTAVGIPLFAFAWRTGTPFHLAVIRAAVLGPLIVAAAVALLTADMWVTEQGDRLSDRLRDRLRSAMRRKGPD